MYRVAIITLSDAGHQGLREDKSAPLIAELAAQAGLQEVSRLLLPDDRAQLAEALRDIADHNRADLVLTTGGTGFSPRDVTPEATLDVVERLVPGIPEAMRAYSMQLTDRAMLSRAVAGIRGATFMINLPGSPKAVRECLTLILPAVMHGLDILCQNAQNCART